MISEREDFSGNRNRPLSNVNTCVYIVNHSEHIPTGYVAIHSQNRLSRTSRTCSSLAVIKVFFYQYYFWAEISSLILGQIGNIPVGCAIRQLKEIRKGYNEIIVICGIIRSAAPLGTRCTRS